MSFSLFEEEKKMNNVCNAQILLLLFNPKNKIIPKILYYLYKKKKMLEILHGDDDEYYDEGGDSEIRCWICNRLGIIYMNNDSSDYNGSFDVWMCNECFCFKCVKNKYDNVKEDFNLTKYKDNYWCDSCLVGDKSKDKLEKFGGEMVKKKSYRDIIIICILRQKKKKL